MLALAFVMNTSGQTITLGLWAAGAAILLVLLMGAIVYLQSTPVLEWMVVGPIP